MDGTHSRARIVSLRVLDVRNLFRFAIHEVILAQVPQLRLVAAAGRGQEVVPWVELGEVYFPGTFSIEVSLLHVDA